jgi:Bacterial Ig-like domain (group 3)
MQLRVWMRKAGEVGGAVFSRSLLNKFSTAGLFAVMLLSFAVAGATAQSSESSHLPTSTRLTVTPADATGRTTLTIKVIGGDRGIPSGAVTLSNGTSSLGPSSLGSVLLDENGTATFRVATATAQQITAIYEGDSSFDASSSLTLAVPAASTVPTFTLSATPTNI